MGRPLAKAADDAAGGSSVRVVGAPASVLFVDDEPGVRAAFRRALAQGGIATDVAESAGEALALAKYHPYQVVVTDLSMPGMTGTELIPRLRAVLSDATYLAVTGQSELDPVSERAIDDERLLVFRKPWNNRELVGAVRRALERRMEPPPRSLRPGVGLRVLLLEDSGGDAELFAEAFDSAIESDHELRCVSTLKDAVALLQTERFDLIVSDLSLPDARDLETVVSLQTAAPALPVVVLTGNDDDSVAVRAVQAGAQDYLVKGQIDRHVLKRAIRYSIERKNTEQRLVRMAHYDQLTGLANRTLFRERLVYAMARARRAETRFAVVAVDLDRFKPVNDSLGHDAGDFLLRSVATEFSRAVRETDTVARFGGDEFTLLLDPVGSRDEVDAIVDRLRRAAMVPCRFGDQDIVVTASLGTAVYPEGGDSVDALLRNADRAMYEAKGRSPESSR